jgi:hypothetical protein
MNIFRNSLLSFTLLSYISAYGQVEHPAVKYKRNDTLYLSGNPTLQLGKTKEKSFIKQCLIKNSVSGPVTRFDFMKGYNECKSCQYKYNRNLYLERLYNIQLRHSTIFNAGKNVYNLSSYSVYYNNLYSSYGSMPWIKLPTIKTLSSHHHQHRHPYLHFHQRRATLLIN